MSNIEDRLDRIETKLDALMAMLRLSGGALGARGAVGAVGTVGTAGTAGTSARGGVFSANDSDPEVDIDGPRGDPDVRFVPKRWSGADYKGQKFSACEPEFLDVLADAYEWFAKRDDETGAVDKNGNPKSRWSRLDGGRARQWAARLRNNNGTAAPKTRSAAMNSDTHHALEPTSHNGYHSPTQGTTGDDDIPF